MSGRSLPMPRLLGWLGYKDQSPFLAYLLSGALKSTAIGTILLLQFRRVFPQKGRCTHQPAELATLREHSKARGSMREQRDIATRLRPEDPPGGTYWSSVGVPTLLALLARMQPGRRSSGHWRGCRCLVSQCLRSLACQLTSYSVIGSAGLALSIACKLPILQSSSYSRRSGVLTSRSAFNKPTPKSHPAC